MKLLVHREIALGRWHPQTGAPCVKDHREVLRRGADADLPKVLGVHVVLEGDDVSLVMPVRPVRPIRSVWPIWSGGPVLEH